MYPCRKEIGRYVDGMNYGVRLSDTCEREREREVSPGIFGACLTL